MTSKEGYDLVKEHAASKYGASTRLALRRLIETAYNKFNPDVEGRDVTKKLSTVMRGVGVRQRQYENLLNRLKDDGIVEYTRDGGFITYRLSLAPLAELDNVTDVLDRQKRVRNKARTEGARAVRARNRSLAAQLIQLGYIFALMHQQQQMSTSCASPLLNN